MRKFHFILSVLAIILSYQAEACSMYKVSVEGKTIVGNNEDAWRTTPHVWFEIGKNRSYGCCFTGSRSIGKNRFAAQSGMNEHGLTFSRLASYHPEKNDGKKKSLKLIENPDQFLMDVMHACKNIDDAYAMLDQYDRSCFIGDVFVYVEPSGKYLVVEPYKLILGSDPSYVQSNYCPSITAETDRRKLERYRKGRDLLNSEIDTTWAFCANLSKEMHVCRDKIGDGTLLTTIWNTSQLQFKIFFYHDFTSNVSFDLMEELAKGDHQVEIKTLFPENEEFSQLETYVTPFNTPWIRVLLALVGLFFALSSIYFLVAGFRLGKTNRTRGIQFILSLVFFLGFCYCFVLATTMDIFYCPAPFSSMSALKSIAAYIPHALSALVLLLAIMFWTKRKIITWSIISKSLIAMNVIAVAGLFAGFFYWELF